MNLHIEDNTGVNITAADDGAVGMRAGDAVNIAASSYNDLNDKPTIEGVTIEGDLTADDFGLLSKAEIEAALNEKANAADLSAVAFSGSYNELKNKPAIPSIPENVSAFNNDAGYITDAGVTTFNGQNGDITYNAPVTSVNNKVGAVSLSAADLGALPDTYTPPATKVNDKTGNVVLSASDVGALPNTTAIPSKVSDLTNDSNFTTKTYVDEADDDIRGKIFYGVVDSTSTSTVFTAQIEGITEYVDGLAVMLKNGVVTSAAGFTIDINGLGAKQAYSNMAAATAESTMFNVNYTMLFVYDSSRVEGGGWILYRGYNANDNTIGYQVRTNLYSLPAKDKFVRYRLLFTSADQAHFVPANTSTSTNATAKRDTNQTPINPFGPIVYYGTTAAVAVDARPAVGSLWQQYGVALGYSFNRTGAALTLTAWKPVYLKCTPQANCSAIIEAETPFVQDLPATNDGKIYVFLGVAYSATNIELNINHPVYYHDGTSIRLWTGPTA